MDSRFRQGYIIYGEEKSGVVIVTPHSGPAMENPTSRDDNSETVAGLCWKKTGGKLIISTMPRRRLWGIDFNRDIPPIEIALSSYKIFEQDTNQDYISHYMKKYAWVSKDDQDYENRLRIYQSFWSEVGKGEKIILVHRAFNRVRSLPSIIDFVTFKSRGIREKEINKIVKELNKKYRFFLRSIERPYKKEVMDETEKRVLGMIRKYGSFDVGRFSNTTKELIKKDIVKTQKYARPYITKRLNERFTAENYLRAVGDTLRNSPKPEITIENVADGSLALGPNRKLFPTAGKVIMEVEPTHFMNRWYPNITAEIICEVIKKVS
ncbi:MAG: hypothetical protein KKG60_04190 [Nanoarchaeota archaeon]|nr:hypothetical protein [Nanoarchaeota archaeon]